MKFSKAKAYFQRGWGRAELFMDPRRARGHALHSLRMVYITLFFTLLIATFGAFLHLIWEAGGWFTVLSGPATTLCLYATPPRRLKLRIMWLMTTAYFLGASVGLITTYLVEVDQSFVFTFMASTTISSAYFWLTVRLTSRLSTLYRQANIDSMMLNALRLLVSYFMFEAQTVIRQMTVFILQVCLGGYLAIYSQEILYEARDGEFDYIDRTFTILLHLPGILFHVLVVLAR